jgi:hypothetical protein
MARVVPSAISPRQCGEVLSLEQIRRKGARHAERIRELSRAATREYQPSIASSTLESRTRSFEIDLTRWASGRGRIASLRVLSRPFT